jgi:hypothetical protein
MSSHRRLRRRRSGGREGSSYFFEKKKKQKTFAPLRAVVPPPLPHPTGIKVFFASFLRPDDAAALAAPSKLGRLFGSKKKTLPFIKFVWNASCD